MSTVTNKNRTFLFIISKNLQTLFISYKFSLTIVELKKKNPIIFLKKVILIQIFQAFSIEYQILKIH